MARPKGIWTPELVRNRIRATKLMQRLQNHVLGDEQMSTSQVKAAAFLLERLVPRAEAPKDLNLKGDLKITVVSGVP